MGENVSLRQKNRKPKKKNRRVYASQKKNNNANFIPQDLVLIYIEKLPTFEKEHIYISKENTKRKKKHCSWGGIALNLRRTQTEKFEINLVRSTGVLTVMNNSLQFGAYKLTNYF